MSSLAKDGNVSGSTLQEAMFTKSEQASGMCLKTDQSPLYEIKFLLILGMCITLYETTELKLMLIIW